MKTLLTFCVLSTTALGADCEERFAKSGNPMTGTKYTSSVTVAGLSVPDAIAQLHGIAVQRNLDVLTEDAANGAMLLEDPETVWHKAIPYLVSAAGEGASASIQIMVKLNKGAFAKAEDVKNEICSILAQVKGGEEGKAAALQAASATSAKGPRRVDAVSLSLDLARQAKDSAESIPLRYKGRALTVSGRVKYVTKDGDVYRVAFDVPEPRGLILQLGAPAFKIDISCLMAPSQAAWAIALRAGEKVSLTGTYFDFDQFKNVMWLGECKPELR